MELYVLTQAGRMAIPMLQKEGRDDEANTLEFLGKADGGTLEQVAEVMNLDEKTAYNMLRALTANRWVWRKTTELTLF